MGYQSEEDYDYACEVYRSNLYKYNEVQEYNKLLLGHIKDCGIDKNNKMAEIGLLETAKTNINKHRNTFYQKIQVLQLKDFGNEFKGQNKRDYMSKKRGLLVSSNLLYSEKINVSVVSEINTVIKRKKDEITLIDTNIADYNSRINNKMKEPIIPER